MNLNKAITSGRAFLVFSVAVSFALVFPWLLQDGMFMDGLLYADVAQNYADGIGTFWHPQTDEAYPKHFHEQPPLVFFLESWFFKIIPNSLYSDRLYCLMMFLITLGLLPLVWQSLTRNLPVQHFYFLPVLFYFICPTVFWSYINNVIEITVVNFVLVAALFLGKVYEAGWKRFWLFVAGSSILFASLCKGVQSIFIIVFPFFHWLVYRQISFRRLLIDTMVLVAPLIMFYTVACCFETVREAYHTYFNNRFTATFSGGRDTVPTRFYLFWDLVQVFIPMFIVLLLLFQFGRKHLAKFQTGRNALFLFCIGFSGILPMMVTLEQRVFYNLPAFPYVMMAFSLLVLPGIVRLFEITTSRMQKVVIYLSTTTIIITVILGIAVAGTPKRDENILHDIYAIGPVTGRFSVLGSDYSLYTNWSVTYYFGRYFHIALDSKNNKAHDWYIVYKGKKLPVGFSPVNIGLRQLVLGKKVEQK